MRLRAFFQRKRWTNPGQLARGIGIMAGGIPAASLAGLFCYVIIVDWRVGGLFLAGTGIALRCAIALAQLGAHLYNRWELWRLQRLSLRMMKTAREYEEAIDRLFAALQTDQKKDTTP